MRKRKVGRKFGRTKAQRNALILGIAESLFEHGKIRTTEARAKEVRRVAERAITCGRGGTLQARRILQKSFRPATVRIIVNDIAPRYKERSGGYTRIIKLGQRSGDRASMVYLELIS